MSEILMNVADDVATVTLNRPEQRNRLSKTMLETLIRTCEELRERSDVRVVVVAAAGRDFSTGVDLMDPGMLEIARQPLGLRRRHLQIGPRAVDAIQTLPQTSIAAMQGHCLGGGGCLALACDLRIAATDLSFGMPEVERGMNMSWRTVPLMVAHFGPTRTKELLMTGHRLNAEEAVAWGLANRRVDGPGRAALDEAARWARQIAETIPPIAASMVKETVNAIANAHTALAHMDGDQFLLAQSTEDFREAVTAFLQKRPPRFRNC